VRERRSEPGKEERKEGEWRGVARGLQGILLVLHSEQEVAAVASWDRHAPAFQLEEEDDMLLHITPWTLQVF
jgi:hypothetical protein